MQIRQITPAIGAEISGVHLGDAELGFIEGAVDDPALARWPVGADQMAEHGLRLAQRQRTAQGFGAFFGANALGEQIGETLFGGNTQQVVYSASMPVILVH